MGNGQVAAQSAHVFHLVAVHGVNHRPGAEKEQSFEKGVGKEMKEGGGITLAGVAAKARNAQGRHHKTNLRDGGKGQHPFDVGLYTGHHGGVKCGKGGDNSHHFEHARCKQGVDREEAGKQKHPGHDHGGRMNKGGDRRRPFHGVGQPDVQRKEGTLAGAPHKDEQGGP